MYLGCFTILMLTPECWNQGSVGLLSIDDVAFWFFWIIVMLPNSFGAHQMLPWWICTSQHWRDRKFWPNCQTCQNYTPNLEGSLDKGQTIYARSVSLHKSSALWRTNWLLLVVRISHFDSSVHWTCCYFLHTFSVLKWGFILIPHLNSGFLATSLT